MKKTNFLLMLGIIFLVSTCTIKATIFKCFEFEIPYKTCKDDRDYKDNKVEKILSYGPKTVVFEQDGYTISAFNKQIIHLAKTGKEDAPFFMKHLKRNIDAIELICDSKGNPVFIAAYSGTKTLNFIKKSKLQEIPYFLGR